MEPLNSLERVIWEDIDYVYRYASRTDVPRCSNRCPLTRDYSHLASELVSVIVKKAVHMANKMNIEVAGIVENMSYVLCPDCGKRIDVFGSGKTEEIASAMGIPFLGKVPMDLNIAKLSDLGEIEKFTGDYLDFCIEYLEERFPV